MANPFFNALGGGNTPVGRFQHNVLTLSEQSESIFPMAIFLDLANAFMRFATSCELFIKNPHNFVTAHKIKRTCEKRFTFTRTCDKLYPQRT